MNSEQRLYPHPQVVDTELESAETVLLHLDNMQYYSLNGTATRIWQLLKAGSSIFEISRKLEAEFDIDAAHANRSVEALIDQLVRRDLVAVGSR